MGRYYGVLLMEKKTSGRKMAETGKMFNGDIIGIKKKINRGTKERMNLWRNKVEVEKKGRKGGVWKGGEEERGINPSRC